MQKAVALISGGFDSPVAIDLMNERFEIIAVHFHQVPLTDEKSIEKVKELVKILNISKLYIVPFAEVFKHLVEKCDHKNYFILSKIVMLQAAQKIAQIEGANFLITGENLAQVSSQTLQNLNSISKNISLEILRPLLTYDKQEIINKARQIGTYQTSEGPEICDLLGPKNPATRSNPEEIKNELSKLDETLIDKSLKNAEIVNEAV